MTHKHDNTHTHSPIPRKSDQQITIELFVCVCVYMLLYCADVMYVLRACSRADTNTHLHS